MVEAAELNPRPTKSTAKDYVRFRNDPSDRPYSCQSTAGAVPIARNRSSSRRIKKISDSSGLLTCGYPRVPCSRQQTKSSLSCPLCPATHRVILSANVASPHTELPASKPPRTLCGRTAEWSFPALMRVGRTHGRCSTRAF